MDPEIQIETILVFFGITETKQHSSNSTEILTE